VSAELERQLARLEACRTKRPDSGEAVRLLKLLGARTFRSAESLIRFHEAVLFLRAYPPDRATRDLAERILSRFGERVLALARPGANLVALDEPEVAGIAGTQISTDYSFDVVRWLARRFPARIRLDWGTGSARSSPGTCRCSRKRRSRTPTCRTSSGSARRSPIRRKTSGG
jgi:hypothetical protein